MRLQLAFLAVAVILVDWCSAYVVQNNNITKANNDSANKITSKPPDDKPDVEILSQSNMHVFSPIFRSRSNRYLNTMQPRFGPTSLKRFSVVPLRGFFAFRNPQSGAGPVQYRGELMNVSNLNCSEDSTNCRDRHPPRQISKRMTMASGIPNRRTRRPYDVPQIECPPARDGSERFSCPSPDRSNRYRCIEDRALCDGFIDCPNAEDEDMRACMFYKTTKAHLDVLADALLRWARGRY